MISREEAIKHLHYISGFIFDVEWKESLDMAIEALEKQIPKKPIAVDWSEEFEGALIEDRCALCSTYLHYMDRYCPKCGQAIDWSDSE